MIERRRFLGASAFLSTVATQATGRGAGEKLRGDQVEVVHTRVFAANSGGGNPCPVVKNADQLTDVQMLCLAKRWGRDTAFILRPQSTDADIRIRFFVPAHEMGVSGHATIAAVTVMLSQVLDRSGQMTIETTTGLFEVAWTFLRNRYLVTVAQDPPVFGPLTSPGAVAHALGIHLNQIDSGKSPIQSVSVSRPKLIVPLTDWQVLDRLKPDFEALWSLCDSADVSGLYPFTRHTNKPKAMLEARQFPVRAGISEDAATGVAAAALGAYLTRYDLALDSGHHAFWIAQGYAMGEPSLIESITECADGKITRTAVRGAAEIIRRERVRV